MRMVAAVRTPLHRSGSLALGQKKFRKEILVKGPLHVNGETFEVSDDYLNEIKRAFDLGAIKSPPVQLAPADNSHSEDLSRRRGTIVGLHRTARGLDADVELNDEAAQMISEWPDTGVSVLVKHNRTTGEGESYQAALAHLLLTADPVITTLTPWTEELAAANGPGEVLDLLKLSLPSGEDTTTPDPAAAPEPTDDDAPSPGAADPSSDEGAHNPSEEESAVPDIDQLIADPAKLAELRNALAALDEQTPQDAPGDATSTDGSDTVPDPDNGDGDGENTEGGDDEQGDTDDAIPTDEEIAAMLQTADDAATDTPAQVAASHSGDQADNALALANMSSQLEEMRLANEETSRKLAAAEWKTERDGWIHANIPPALIDKCEPFLNGASDKLALSNSGDKPKVAAALRTVLTEISKQAPSLGLGQGPIGTQAEIDEERQQAEAAAESRRQRASQVTAHLK